MRRLVLRIITLAVIGALAIPITASASSPYGVYDNYKDFEAAKRAADAVKPQAAAAMTDAQKQARRELISRSIHKLSAFDRKGFQDLANKYHLVIHNSNLATVQAFSDSSALRTIANPIMTYDATNYETGIEGRIDWIDMPALVADANNSPGNMGGMDTALLSFSNFDSADTSSNWVDTYDCNSKFLKQNFNKDIIAGNPISTPGNYTAAFTMQDHFLGNTAASGIYDWCSVDVNVWSVPHLADHGSVVVAYAHTYQKAVLQSQAYTGGAPTSTQLGFSFSATFTYNQADQKWGAQCQGVTNY